jgi:hypothetical protein
MYFSNQAFAFVRLCLLAMIGLGFVPTLQAQIDFVDLPSNPPDDYIYQAGDGSTYFEQYKAEAIRQQLRNFENEVGLKIIFVTVNSPEKSVLKNLQDQIKKKWSYANDCMVIIFDLDTNMLAVQFEQTFHDSEGQIMPSQLMGVSETAWIQSVDSWLNTQGDKKTLIVSQIIPFLDSFLPFLHEEILINQQKKKSEWVIYLAVAVVLLLLWYAYLYVQTIAGKAVPAKRFQFPAFHDKCRLGAHYGGGTVSSRKYDDSK